MSKKIFGLALAPLAVAVLAVTLVGGSSSQARETTPASQAPAEVAQYYATDIYECFRAAAIPGTNLSGADLNGADPKAEVRLETDNFGRDYVVVRKLVAMCESGLKYRPGEIGETEQEPEILVCYSIEYGQAPDEPVVLDTDNFGDNFAWVKRSTMMCERGTKTIGEQTYGDGEFDGSPIWQCFNIATKPELRRFTLVTQNFGAHNVLTFGGVQMCEEAVKYRPDSEPVGSTNEGGYVQECFRVERLDIFTGGTSNAGRRATLWTQNFGAVEATIGRPFMMCEEAEKERLDTVDVRDDVVNPGSTN